MRRFLHFHAADAVMAVRGGGCVYIIVIRAYRRLHVRLAYETSRK